MSPEEVIASELNTEIVGNSGDANGGRLTYSRSLDLARQGLAALRAAGYELVKLPDAASISESHITYGHGGDCEFDCCPPWVKDEDLDYEYSVSEARLYAAALLAAAVAAEETR